MVIYVFDGIEKVEGLNASSEWQALSKIGEQYATFNIYAVEGVE